MSRLPAFLRRLPADPRPDADLLAAFRRDRDEAAFAELVRRHGPVVWGVCRRYLPDPADAEDAFQAAFLVLVRRAGQLTAAPAVGPWLYRVAAWTARNVRRKNARRLARCVPLTDDNSTLTGAVRQDLSLDLDAALLALPEKYRIPLVLCHLQGWTRRAAAEHLGCPEGTLSALLSRGLAKLRDRLAGREPAAVLAAAAAGAVPAELAAATVRTAAAFQLSAASPAVVHLAEGVLRMFWVKKATAAVAAVMLLVTGVGVGLGVKQVPAVADDRPAAGKPTAAPADLDTRAKLDRLRALLHVSRLDAGEWEKRQKAAEKAARAYEADIAQLERTANDEKPPAKADKPDPAKEIVRLEETEKAIQLEQRKLLEQQHEAARRREEVLARIARLKAGKSEPTKEFELVVGSAAATHPYSFRERGADGDVVLSAYAPGEVGLRRYLARMQADPKAPKSVVISAAKDVPFDRLAAAILAAKAAGFGKIALAGDVPPGTSFGRGRVIAEPRLVDRIQLDLAEVDEVRPPAKRP